MAQLKRDHSGWRSHGLYLKYKQPAVDEKPAKGTKKKNTTKWCKGKVGTEHKLYRYYYYTRPYNGNKPKKTTWIRSRCEICRKEFLTKDTSIPLRIQVENVSEYRQSPVQVKVNGKAIPIDSNWYYNRRYLCDYCGKWHTDY